MWHCGNTAKGCDFACDSYEVVKGHEQTCMHRSCEWSSAQIDVVRQLITNTDRAHRDCLVNASYLDPDCPRGERHRTALGVASEIGNLELVQELLALRADPAHTFGPHDVSALHIASQEGHALVCKVLVDAGVACNSESSNRTPLHAACYYGYQDVVKQLLTLGAAIDIKDNLGQSALHQTCLNYMASKGVVTELLRHKASVDLPDKQGNTPLIVACAHTSRSDRTRADRTQFQVIKLLLDGQASVNHLNHDAHSPLRVASTIGAHEIVALLLEHRASQTQKDVRGNTSLHVAARNGHEQTVAVLLRYTDMSGLTDSLNCKDDHQRTALHRASRNGHTKVVRQLLVHNADPNCDVIQSACTSGKEALIKMLLEFGASANTADEKGYTPLRIACERGHETAVRLLLDHSAQIDNGPEDCVLHNASYKGQLGTVKILLEHQADVESVDLDGKTALHHVLRAKKPICETEEYEVNQHLLIRELVEWSVKLIHQMDSAGNTPLHTAVKYRRTEAIALLASLNADINATNSKGQHHNRKLHVLYTSNGHKGVFCCSL